MKPLMRIFAGLLTVGLVMFGGSRPAMPQCCGGVCIPPEIATLTLSDGSTVEATWHRSGGSTTAYNGLTIIGDGYGVSIEYAPDEVQTASMSIWNSDNPYAWGAGILSLHAVRGYPPPEEPVDITVLPPELRELWTTLQRVCGELIEDDEFWQILKDQDEEVLASLKSDMESMRDGYFSPHFYEQVLGVQRTLGGWYPENGSSRGYALRGPIDLQITTPSPYGDQNPEIRLRVSSNMPNDRWNISISPDTRSCEIWLDNVEAVQQLTRDDWEAWVERFRNGLEFFRSQLPFLTEIGVLGPSDDLDFLLEKSLEGINSFPIELTYPDEWSESIL